MAKRWRPPETGIEIMYGRPGSGKSLFAVKRSIKVMREQRRPVYTNLPLRMRVIRQYLRVLGGEELARLIRPLTEEHFNRFIRRYAEHRRFKELQRSANPFLSRLQLRDFWLAEAGPDVTSGDDANWIPAGSLVIIDEAHHWYPNVALKTVIKKEPPELMAYLTMHRHLQHWIWVITQADRQISTTFKALAHRVWRIHPRDDDRLAWGIRFRHLGIKALGYRAYTPEQEEKDEPHENYTDFPWWPTNRVYFRLYDSYTHAGSRRELMEGLRAVRVEAGLDERGRLSHEDESMGVKKKQRSWFVVFLLGLSKMLGFGLVLSLVLVVGVHLGRNSESDDSDVADDAMAAVSSGDEEVSLQPERNRSYPLVSMTSSGVRFANSGRIALGGRYEGLELVAFDATAGLSLWNCLDSGGVWLCELGSVPVYLGSSADVAAALAERESRKRYLRGEGSFSSGAVGGVGRDRPSSGDASFNR